MIILDTDHVTFLELGGPQAEAIARKLDAMASASRPATSIISYEEQVRGWLARLARSDSLTEEVEVYHRLAEHRLFYAHLDVIEFDGAAAVELQRLRSLKLRIGTMDLKIAAIALANNATLFTRNLRDFSRIPNLHAEDATR